MRLGLLRPRSRFFRLNLDSNASSSSSSGDNGGENGRSNPVLKKKKHPGSQDSNGDPLKELCSLVASATSKPNAVLISASSRTKSLQQRYNRVECSIRQVRSSRSSGFFGHADAILDILGFLEHGQEIGSALGQRFESLLSDFLVARVVLGAQSLEMACSFFEWASGSGGSYRPGILAYDCLVHVLVKGGRAGQAYDRFQELSRFSLAPSKFMYGILVDGLAAQGDAEKALAIFEEFKERYGGEEEERVVQCFGFLVTGLCKAGKISEATDHYQRLRKSLRFLSVVVYNSLIDGLVKAKLVDKALEIFSRDMDEALCQPNSHTYGALVSGLCKAGRIAEACELFQQMIERRYTPHVVLYTTVIDGLCKARQFDKACSYLEKMESPDIVTYSAFIDGLCNVGKVDYAFELLKQIQERGNARPDVVLYTIFIKGLCKAGQVDNAVELFYKMEDIGCPPNAVTYNSLMRALAWHKSVDAARRLFTEMIRKGCEPDGATYVLISEVFLKSKSLEDARKFEEDVRNECGSLKGLAAYVSQINKLCRERKLEEAYRILQTIAKDMQPTVGMYATLVRAFLRDERAMEVDELVKDMVRRGCAPSCELHNAIMAGLRWIARNKKLPAFVHKLVSEMEEKQWIPDALFCTSLVEGLCQAGYPGLAQQLVTQADSRQGSINHHLWDTLVRMLFTSGKLKISLTVAEQALERGCEINILTYYEIIRGLVRLGKVSKALAQFQKMVEHGKPTLSRQMAMVHSSLVTKLCRRGRLEDAYELHQKMVERGLSPTIKSYKLLIKYHFKAGKAGISRQLFEQMQKVDSPQTQDTYRVLLEGYCQAGMLDEAYGALEETVARQFKPTGASYLELIRKLCELGRTEEAHHILQRMVSLGHRPLLLSYNAVFQAYYESGRFANAREVFQEILRLFRIDKARQFPITEDQLRVIFDRPY
ncbi:pentatricopeptide repeat-containing protein At1g12620 [Selaginella moellendorffii]|uniref:pentatricopeptide repeat-containing protein At1g12620 n=1 Tax=Selaginella moellendorffii TaxID=88036 RepID=UPI000D1C4039|nr:pentatricopeptide repeat-containing protein At1g12620 [Selaginella moellendorffii]|eukprot:XP_024520422.1 pentatricopeptide repeat-containing protein At1g12620 [Selaginella moellendorffii]